MAQKKNTDRIYIMTEKTMAQFNREGYVALFEDTENEDSTESPTEINKADDTQAPEGDEKNTPEDPDKDKPFHLHPRWKQREEELNKRFNDQELRHQDDMKTVREEFTTTRKGDEQTDVPSWFGGTDEQYKDYRASRDAEIQGAEDRAYARVNSTKTAEEKLVSDATNYMKSEMTAIESDATLNPTGSKIDPNKLLKIVMDNDLVDSKGKWNYRAGFRMMQSTTPKETNEDRKKLADLTNLEAKGESKPANFKTSADFKKSRPW